MAGRTRCRRAPLWITRLSSCNAIAPDDTLCRHDTRDSRRGPAAGGRARGPLARAARHRPGDRGPRVRRDLARRAPPLSLAGPAGPRTVGGLDADGRPRRRDERVDDRAARGVHGFHNPALLAKQAATIDEIPAGGSSSGSGRAGTRPSSGRSASRTTSGSTGSRRRSRSSGRCSRRARSTSTGASTRRATASCCPRPRPGGPPLLIGSNGPRMLRITMPHAQAWNTWYADTDNTPDGVAPLRDDRRRGLRGTSGATRRRSGGPWRSTSACRAATGRTMGDTTTTDRIVPLEGSPERMADELRAYAAAGVERGPGRSSTRSTAPRSSDSPRCCRSSTRR